MKDMYLTNAQYSSILQKIKETVDAPGFKPSYFDSTFPGDKYTESNCGFCNDNFTEKDMALFPEQFPQRKSLKYRAKNHKCPFDERKHSGILGWGSGCFCGCYLFNNKLHNIKLMQRMTNDLIKEMDEQLIKT